MQHRPLGFQVAPILGLQHSPVTFCHPDLISPALQYLKDEFHIGSAHLLKSRSLGHSIKVPKDEIHAALSQAMRNVHVCRLQDGSCAVDVDRYENFFLTQPFQPLNPKLVSCYKKIHGNVEADLDFVGVKILEECKKD